MHSLYPVAILLISLGALLGLIVVLRRLQRRRDRRSPLTEGLLRPAGHGLSERIHDLQ